MGGTVKSTLSEDESGIKEESRLNKIKLSVVGVLECEFNV
jgi:hypothetical protein